MIFEIFYFYLVRWKNHDFNKYLLSPTPESYIQYMNNIRLIWR